MVRRFLIFMVLNCFALHVNAISQSEITQWLEDINYYVKQVKNKHINPFHTLSESSFDEKINILKQDLNRLTEVEIETRLLGITAAIGDGHTNYYMMSGPHQHFPLHFQFFADELRIIGTSDKYQFLQGSTLDSINGIKLTQLYQSLQGHLIGVDNQYSEKKRFEFYLTLEKLLRGLGIVSEGEPAVFTTVKHGKTQETSISPVSMKDFSNVKSAYSVSSPSFELKEVGLNGIKFALIHDDVAYFQFKHYPSFEKVIAQCETIQRKVKNSPAKHLIIDFRGNSGGSFYAGLAFSACLQPIEQFDWQTGAAILIDGHTFSAAMSNAVQFKQIFNGTLIGEPTGADPNHYAEAYRFQLPNSGRNISLSIRYYPFLFEETDAVYPDITVKQSWEDYKEGKDTGIQSAITHLKSN